MIEIRSRSKPGLAARTAVKRVANTMTDMRRFGISGQVRALGLRAYTEVMDEDTTVTVNDIPEGAAIIDVREDDEWEAGHIEGAIHVPLGELPGRLDDLPLDDDMYVVCRTGGRSNRAVAWLNQNGFDAFNVDGGMGSWNIDNGKPIVSETGEEPWVK
jgi:rhodanese-related sulfurtransferase